MMTNKSSLLQAVEQHRKQYPDFRKSTQAEVNLTLTEFFYFVCFSSFSFPILAWVRLNPWHWGGSLQIIHADGVSAAVRV